MHRNNDYQLSKQDDNGEDPEKRDCDEARTQAATRRAPLQVGERRIILADHS